MKNEQEKAAHLDKLEACILANGFVWNRGYCYYLHTNSHKMKFRIRIHGTWDLDFKGPDGHWVNLSKTKDPYELTPDELTRIIQTAAIQVPARWVIEEKKLLKRLNEKHPTKEVYTYYHAQPQNGIEFTERIEDLDEYLSRFTYTGDAINEVSFVKDLQLTHHQKVSLADALTRKVAYEGTADCFLPGESELIDYLFSDLTKELLQEEADDCDRTLEETWEAKTTAAFEVYRSVSGNLNEELFYEFRANHRKVIFG